MAKIKDRYSIDNLKDIPDVWILDGDFRKLDIIDDYTSLIWSRRYYEVSDFELYVRVTDKNMKLLNVDLSTTVRFVMRNDTKEVMRVEKIEISVDAEEGDFITASGRDLRCLMYQRVNYEKISLGNMIYSPITEETMDTEKVPIVDAIYKLVEDNMLSPAVSQRVMPYLQMGDKPDIPDASVNSIEITESDNIGEKIEELCEDFRIGWRAEWNGSKIVFSCYEGIDRTKEVVFSEEFSNLITFKNTENLEDYYNVNFLYNKYTDSDGDENENKVWFGNDSGFTRFEKGFSSSESLEVSSSAFLRDLIYAYKLPASYALEWYSFTSQSGSDGYTLYTAVKHDGDEPNPDDDNRSANDYMSMDNPCIAITYFDKYSSGFLWLDDNWKIKVSFIKYDFLVYDDDWLEQLKNRFNDKGTIVYHDNVRYYRIDATNDPSLMIQIGTGHIKTWYIGSKGDKRFFWGMTIPAQYSESGDEQTYKIKDGSSTTNMPSVTLENNTIMLSFTLDMDDILQQDRYMAKLYSLVEESLYSPEFEGEIAPDVNYTYREDYDIGDKIKIKTDIGINKDVRIIEAVETFDSDGYNIEVKFGV